MTTIASLILPPTLTRSQAVTLGNAILTRTSIELGASGAGDRCSIALIHVNDILHKLNKGYLSLDEALEHIETQHGSLPIGNCDSSPSYGITARAFLAILVILAETV